MGKGLGDSHILNQQLSSYETSVSFVCVKNESSSWKKTLCTTGIGPDKKILKKPEVSEISSVLSEEGR